MRYNVNFHVTDDTETVKYFRSIFSERGVDYIKSQIQKEFKDKKVEIKYVREAKTANIE
jgi:hypothetical protein